MANIKIGLFLATYKGLTCLKDLLSAGNKEKIGFVCSFRETNVTEAYYEDIKRLCITEDIKYFDWPSIKDNLVDTIKRTDVDMAIAISWKYMLPLAVNEVMKYSLFIFHDSLLPTYRGFAPTPTAIMCGETTLGVSFVVATDEVDKGNIVLQKTYEINDEENIADAIEKQSKLYSQMLLEVVENFDHMDLTGRAQDESMASYSIWRDLQDCHIDWSLSAIEIKNMVRALSNPYPGAYSMLGDEKVIFDKVEVVDDLNFVIRQPGKFWSKPNNQPVIICGEGMLRVIAAHDIHGNPFVFNRLRSRFE